jgi:hypothetical protein
MDSSVRRGSRLTPGWSRTDLWRILPCLQERLATRPCLITFVGMAPLRWVHPLVSWILALVFLAAFFSKLWDPARSASLVEALLGRSPFPGWIFVVAAVEWCLATWLLVGRKTSRPMYAAGGILVVFTATLIVARATGYTGRCGCLWIRMSLGQSLLRNGALLVLVAVSVMTAAPIRQPSGVET